MLKYNFKRLTTEDKKKGPYTLKRMRRFSRMSGFPLEDVKNVFVREYKRILDLNEASSNKKTNAQILSDLYKNVSKILGITSESSAQFVSESRVKGFTVVTASQYLLDMGYSKEFIDSLKSASKISVIPFPPNVKIEYRKEYEKYFEQVILERLHRLDHPITFYAKVIASFVTGIFEAGNNPFNETKSKPKNLPVFALANLYRYKFDILLAFLKTLKGYKLHSIDFTKEFYSEQDKNLSDFRSIGFLTLKKYNKKSDLDFLPYSKELMSGKVIKYTNKKGVKALVSSEGDLIKIEYEISINTNLRTYGIKDLKNWIKVRVIDPCFRKKHAFKFWVRGK